MCWNADVSIKSFIIGLTAIIAGALTGYLLHFCYSIALLYVCNWLNILYGQI